MGKFQNYELNEEQRRIELAKYNRRMELRAQFWRNMTDPNRHGSGEGGALVSFQHKIRRTHNLTTCLYLCYVIKSFVYILCPAMVKHYFPFDLVFWG